MGCTNSKIPIGIECPRGYDKRKFNTLLMLYDKIDRDGNQAVDINEISEISNLHIKNRLLLLEMEVDNEKKKYDNRLLNIKSTKNLLLGLSQKEKNEMFCKAVTGKDRPSKIGWDDFFNYMKDRSDDIPNIVF